jgi:hypothetical protein
MMSTVVYKAYIGISFFPDEGFTIFKEAEYVSIALLFCLLIKSNLFLIADFCSSLFKIAEPRRTTVYSESG